MNPSTYLSERDFQRTVVDLAKVCGWWVRHDRLAQQSTPGWPDLALIRIGPDGVGRLILAELKSERGRQTDAQANMMRLIERCPGVEFYLWRPSNWDEIVKVLH